MTLIEPTFFSRRTSITSTVPPSLLATKRTGRFGFAAEATAIGPRVATSSASASAAIQPLSHRR
jgi:hypothetical protein